MPNVLQIGPLVLPVSLFFMLVAVTAATSIGKWAGRKAGVDVEATLFQTLVVGVVVARLAFVLQFSTAYQASPLAVLDIRDGGWRPLAGFAAAWLFALGRQFKRPALRKPLLAAVFAVDYFRYNLLARKVSRAARGWGSAADEAFVREWLVALRARQVLAPPAAPATPEEPPFLELRLTGRAGNPRYQAFLDTVEQLEEITNNVPYLAWFSARSAEYERLARGQRPPFSDFLRDYAEAHLSDRVRAERMGGTGA